MKRQLAKRIAAGGLWQATLRSAICLIALALISFPVSSEPPTKQQSAVDSTDSIGTQKLTVQIDPTPAVDPAPPADPLRLAQSSTPPRPGGAEPKSRSSLFDAPDEASKPARPGGAEPTSRSALFDAPDASAGAPYRLSGFFDGLAAYNFGDPRHWSRGVGRLQLVAQGALTENIKWKLGGRVDADAVYFSSNFYPDAVKRDQRIDVFHRENYLDFSASGWDFRVGAQHIVWGEVVGLFFADVVSARDQREFILPSFDLIRIPQWAARAEYFKDDSHLELIWIPVPLFDKIGKPGSDFYPVPLPAPLPAAVESLFLEPQRPSRKLSHSNYGLRANTLVSGWDVAAFYYRSFSTQPTFYRQPADTFTGFVVQPRYDRIWQAGATLTKDFDTFVLRSEAMYTHGQNFSTADPLTHGDVVSRKTLDWIVGVEFPFPNDTRLNLQAFQRAYFGGDDSAIAIRAGGFGVTALVSTKITDTLEPSILWIQTFDGGGSLVRPKLSWSFAKNFTLGVGADIFAGSQTGFFGRFNDRDRVYTELRYDF